MGPGIHACLQPENLIGDSNAGLLTAGGGLAVDSFWDLPRTRALLDHWAEVLPAPPRRLLTTHDNGDHCWGNELFAAAGAEIIGHRRCAEEMQRGLAPDLLAALCDADPPPGMEEIHAGLSRFDFHGITLTPPTTVVDDDSSLDLDGLEVQLLYVGPAHTAGDLAVWIPAHGVLFTGDVLFHECAPVSWAGTTDTWIASLERLAALDPAVVVPGHGPVTDRSTLLELRDYLAYVRDESVAHHDAGRTVLEAAERLELAPWRSWNEPERVVFQVARAYREAEGQAWDAPVDGLALFADMQVLRQRWTDD